MWVRQFTDEDESCIYEYRKDGIVIVAEYGGWHAVYNKAVWEVRVWTGKASFRTTVYLPGRRGAVARPTDELGESLVSVAHLLLAALASYRGIP